MEEIKNISRLFIVSLFLLLSFKIFSLELGELTIYIDLEEDITDPISGLYFFDKKYEPIKGTKDYRIEAIVLNLEKTMINEQFANERIVQKAIYENDLIVKQIKSDDKIINGVFETDFFLNNSNRFFYSRLLLFNKKVRNNFSSDIQKERIFINNNLTINIKDDFTFTNDSFFDRERGIIELSNEIGFKEKVKRTIFTEKIFLSYNFTGNYPQFGGLFGISHFGVGINGYLNFIDKKFNPGAKISYNYKYFFSELEVDFKTDFKEISVKIDGVTRFSNDFISFSIFKSTYKRDNIFFLSKRESIYKYSNDIKTIAGFDFSLLYKYFSFNLSANSYLDNDFLLITNKPLITPPNIFGKISIESFFNNFNLNSSNYINVINLQTIDFGFSFGLSDINIGYIFLYCNVDFTIEDNLSYYRVALESKIETKIMNYFSFYIKTNNEFYFNKPKIDFYIQSGFIGIF